MATAPSMSNPREPYHPIFIDYLDWIRGERDPPTYEDTDAWDIFGIKKSGKSSFVEAVLTQYIARGSSGIDAMSANDNEALAWYESPYRDGILLLTADDVKVQGPMGVVSKPASQFTYRDIREHCLIITVRAFYTTEREMYVALNGITELLRHRTSWPCVDVIAIRESEKFIASRVGSGQDRSRQDAAQSYLNFFTEAGHSGFASVTDVHRRIDLAKGIRTQADHTIIKAIGGMEIEDELHWIMRSISPNPTFEDGERFEGLKNLKPWEFYDVTKTGSIAYGNFGYPPWHIQRGVDLMEKLGITVYHVKPEAGDVVPMSGYEAPKPEKPLPTYEHKVRKITQEVHLAIIAIHEADPGLSLRGLAREVYRTKGLPISHSTVSEELSRHKSGLCECAKGGKD